MTIKINFAEVLVHTVCTFLSYLHFRFLIFYQTIVYEGCIPSLKKYIFSAGRVKRKSYFGNSRIINKNETKLKHFYLLTTYILFTNNVELEHFVSEF